MDKQPSAGFLAVKDIMVGTTSAWVVSWAIPRSGDKKQPIKRIRNALNITTKIVNL
jgi:hypothetical protein